MTYTVKIRKEALTDIQDIVAWYETQKTGLGNRFKTMVYKYIDHLETFPHVYGIRYSQIRCIPVGKFPYMVHFRIDEERKAVEIYAVISTHRDPEIWYRKTNRQK